jgi:enamine deaminase RidA (YjgF/YER057c/UK114 family)
MVTGVVLAFGVLGALGSLVLRRAPKLAKSSWQCLRQSGCRISGYLEKEINMSTRPKATALMTREHSGPEGAEQRLKELAIKLPVPPKPFGTYVEAVQTGKLLFLTGMLPTEGRGAKFIGHVGAELDVEAGRKAAHLAALNVLAVARQHLGSLDKVAQIVRASACRWPHREMSATSRELLTPLRSCCKRFSEKKRTLAA